MTSGIKLRFLALVLLAVAAGCSTYGGPISNVSEGYHEVGQPTGG